MNKDKMKNKYSAFITEISEILGLGKPVDIIKLCATTDLFFQPLEKRITDLEKENTALRQEWDVMKSTITDAENLCDKLEKENADLQQKYLEESFEKAKLVKTNTKLKEKENTVHTLDVLHKEAVRKYGEVNDQLTKAKELLKKWVELFKPKGGNIPPTPIQVDTEQFLNSEVEK